MRFLKSSFVVVCALVLSGCKGSPIGPGGGGGPDPGGDLRAAMSLYGIYEGECTKNPADCVGQLAPTEDPELRFLDRETYVLKDFDTKYTAWLCVSHPEIPGRTLTIMVDSPRKATETGVTHYPKFDEGDPENRSPICISGEPFDMILNGGRVSTKSGAFSFMEVSKNRIPLTDWKLDLGFRVLRR